MWIPPHIPPTQHVAADMKTLKTALTCTIATWPEVVYTGDFYRPPAKGILFVMNPTAVEDVLIKQADHFDQGPILRRILGPIWRSGLAVAKGAEWRWQRRALAPVFTPKMAGHVVPLAAAAARQLADNWQDGQTVEITGPLGKAVNDVVFNSFLADSADEADRAAFAAGGDALTQSMSKINLADLLGWPGWLRPVLGPTSRRSSKYLHRLVEKMFAKNAAAEPTALLQHLHAAKDPETGQQISQAQVRDNIVGSLAAGRETTALAIAWALWLVGCDPDIQAELTAERGDNPINADTHKNLPLHRQVIYEAMRLYPPAPQIARQATTQTRLLDQDISKGETIVLPVYALHRRPAVWDNPDAFDPHRFSPERFDMRAARGSFLPFGAGARICIGMSFALAEAQTMLATILARFEVSADRNADPGFQVGTTLRPGNGLHITLKAR